MAAPNLRTRLNCETMEVREVMSASFGFDLGIDPGVAFNPVPVEVAPAGPAGAIPVAAPAPQNGEPVPLRATPGVTRVHPTIRDRVFMSRLANKQWFQVVTFTNPLSGNFVEQYNEMVLVRGGRYSFQSVWVEYTPLGPVSYPLFTEGRWWVQNNGRLVMQAYNPTSAAEYTFMTLRAVNNRVLVTTDNGRWERVVGGSRIPGPL